MLRKKWGVGDGPTRQEEALRARRRGHDRRGSEESRVVVGDVLRGVSGGEEPDQQGGCYMRAASHGLGRGYLLTMLAALALAAAFVATIMWVPTPTAQAQVPPTPAECPAGTTQIAEFGDFAIPVQEGETFPPEGGVTLTADQVNPAGEPITFSFQSETEIAAVVVTTATVSEVEEVTPPGTTGTFSREAGINNVRFCAGSEAPPTPLACPAGTTQIAEFADFLPPVGVDETFTQAGVTLTVSTINAADEPTAFSFQSETQIAAVVVTTATVSEVEEFTPPATTGTFSREAGINNVRFCAGSEAPPTPLACPAGTTPIAEFADFLPPVGVDETFTQAGVTLTVSTINAADEPTAFSFQSETQIAAVVVTTATVSEVEKVTPPGTTGTFSREGGEENRRRCAGSEAPPPPPS